MFRNLGTAVMALACITANMIFPSNPAGAQRQATSIGYLTTTAARERPIAPIKQWPSRGRLIIPPEMRIEPPLAWNRLDRYQPPNFEEFFPDDPEGGKQLDALFQGQLGGHHAPEDVIAAVRWGLRNTNVYTSQILAQIGNGFVWGAKEQDPRAIELLYHASDVATAHSHEGMYYGLCVLNNPAPNVIRTMMNNYTRYGGSIQHRILWGLGQYGDRDQTAKLIEDLLRNPEGLSDSGAVSALDLYRELTGRSFDDAGMLADKGMFVIGFTHQDRTDAEALRDKLDEWLDDPDAIIGFVLRFDADQPVGVALIRGIGNRDKATGQIDADRQAGLLFAETFAPVVLQSRQLREFASALPGGLPPGAKPNYAPIPTDESFAWNADDYQPADFQAYFPDDPAAGKRLDELYQQRDTTRLTAREQLEIVRAGLRHSEGYANNVIAWVSQISGWPADPMANEILYHAADPRAPQPIRYAAIYYGLSGWWKKPPNVLRLFGEIILTEPFDRSLGSGTVGRITWSLRDAQEKKIVAGHLDRGLRDHEQYAVEKLANLTSVYRQLTETEPSSYREYKDRGKFFIAFRVQRSQSATESKAYAQRLLGAEPYWIAALNGDSDTGVMVILQGMHGMQRAIEKLMADRGAAVDMAGPLAIFDGVDPRDDAAGWIEKIKPYRDSQ